MVDNNELEIESLRELKAGNVEHSHALEDEFFRRIRELPQGACSCHMLDCRWHGKCWECVQLHRGAGDHLPNCFHGIVNKRLQNVLDLTESTVKKNFDH
jgi:hypothetical protein